MVRFEPGAAGLQSAALPQSYRALVGLPSFLHNFSQANLKIKSFNFPDHAILLFRQIDHIFHDTFCLSQNLC